MGLSLTDIRDSGLLELYVLGELAPTERQQVEQAVRTYPELKSELAEIEQAFKHFAFAKTITPAPRVLENTLKQINSGPIPPIPPTTGGGFSFGGLFGILALALAALAGYFWFQADNVKSELAASNAEIKAIRIELQECLDKQNQTTTLEDLELKDNQIVAMTATENYSGSSIYIYNNEETKRNYLSSLVI